MRRARVNGREISEGEINLELDRLMVFYRSHGMSADEIRGKLPELREKALEQAIGAALLFARASEIDIPVTRAEIDLEMEKMGKLTCGGGNIAEVLRQRGIDEARILGRMEMSVKVNKLIAQACSQIEDPSEAEIENYYREHSSRYAPRTLVEVHGIIKDHLRHAKRGHAVSALVSELKERAQIEYVD